MSVPVMLAALFRRPGLWGYLTRRAELKSMKELEGCGIRRPLH
jgi:hypothetical protein